MYIYTENIKHIIYLSVLVHYNFLIVPSIVSQQSPPLHYRIFHYPHPQKPKLIKKLFMWPFINLLQRNIHSKFFLVFNCDVFWLLSSEIFIHFGYLQTFFLQLYGFFFTCWVASIESQNILILIMFDLILLWLLCFFVIIEKLLSDPCSQKLHLFFFKSFNCFSSCM